MFFSLCNHDLQVVEKLIFLHITHLLL